MSKFVHISVLVVLGTVGGAGCLTGRAATPAERPALEVPPPPDRVIPQVPAPEPVSGLVPVIQAIVDRVMIEKDQGLVSFDLGKFLFKPVHGVPWYMAIAHAHIRSRCATEEHDSAIFKTEFVIAENFGEH